MRVYSLGGHQPYVPILLSDDDTRKSATVSSNSNNLNSQYGVSSSTNNEIKQRARVLCSYDAKDSTELNLSANEVNNIFPLSIHTFLRVFSNFFFFQIIFVTECNPINSDYMYGKQGLVSGLVPRAFLEVLEE